MDRLYGQAGEPLVFVHANGYTAGAYRQLLEPLARRYQVYAPELRPLTDGAAPTRDWHELARELGHYVDATCEPPAIGVGHSLGAVALLLAAAIRPARFRQLVLIEPLAFPRWASLLLRVAPRHVRTRGAMVQGARKRRDRWSSLDEAFAAERRRRSLARIPDAVLHDILEDGLVPHPEGGVTLRFTKEWEARLYESPASIWPALRTALPPLTVLRGADSRVLSRRDLQQWRARCPHHRQLEIAGAGHLLPLELPQQVATQVLAELPSCRAESSDPLRASAA